jgi:hypothetical protein
VLFKLELFHGGHYCCVNYWYVEYYEEIFKLFMKNIAKIQKILVYSFESLSLNPIHGSWDVHSLYHACTQLHIWNNVLEIFTPWYHFKQNLAHSWALWKNVVVDKLIWFLGPMLPNLLQFSFIQIIGREVTCDAQAPSFPPHCPSCITQPCPN